MAQKRLRRRIRQVRGIRQQKDEKNKRKVLRNRRIKHGQDQVPLISDQVTNLHQSSQNQQQQQQQSAVANGNYFWLNQI